MADLDQQIRAILNGYDHDAAGQIDDLTGAIRAVLDLHQPTDPGRRYASCLTCSDPRDQDTAQEYPCETLRAIATQLGLTQETTP